MEYAMMSLSLWITAAAAVWVLLNLANGSRSFDFLVVPTSALIITVPIMAFFFIRLKKAEFRDPVLRADPSRRRWTQLTQFLAFLVTIVNLIVLVYEILVRYGTNKTASHSIGKTIMDAVIVLAVAGGILVYYWLDEHRPVER